MGDCIVRLNQLIDQLSPAEARVARYLLDHCQEAIGQPIEKVSEACQTSKTTVVRLCKQLGFKGYKALSIALSMELASGGENRISYQDINRKTIDRWVDDGWEWGKPISREVYAAAKNGQWDVKLTPVKFVPHDWFGDLKDRRVLGLAAGGGQQMPIFAALGAKCTVLDYSEKQLESERMVAQRESYDITIVHADMTKRLPFDDNSFDLIFHPVSNCYVYAVLPIWRECARVLKPGGRLLAGLDNGFNYAFDEDETKIINTLPFNPLEDEGQMRQLQKDDSGIQFSHTAHEQLTGQLKAGLQLLDLYEDTNGYGNLHAHNIPTYWATLARKA